MLLAIVLALLFAQPLCHAWVTTSEPDARERLSEDGEKLIICEPHLYNQITSVAYLVNSYWCEF